MGVSNTFRPSPFPPDPVWHTVQTASDRPSRQTRTEPDVLTQVRTNGPARRSLKPSRAKGLGFRSTRNRQCWAPRCGVRSAYASIPRLEPLRTRESWNGADSAAPSSVDCLSEGGPPDFAKASSRPVPGTWPRRSSSSAGGRVRQNRRLRTWPAHTVFCSSRSLAIFRRRASVGACLPVRQAQGPERGRGTGDSGPGQSE